MSAVVGAAVVGGLFGLAVRPLLDAYLIWRASREARMHHRDSHREGARRG